MSLDLLDTPVRLTWDFPDAPELSDVKVLAIADAIVEGGVFYVTLQGRPLLHPELSRVVASLSGSCQLLVFCRGDADELAHLETLPKNGCRLLLDVAGFVAVEQGLAEGRLRETIEAVRTAGFEPEITLTPLRENLHNIPDILRFCADSGLSKFKLPNAHIGDSFHEYTPDQLPRWQDLESFRKLWCDYMAESPNLPSMEIHDLFLWEIMTPDQQQNRSEYGGCQAGNSLGHVDVQGVVHPCAAWPEALGSLLDEELYDIWAGERRSSVRTRIDGTPQGCIGCRDLTICFGGCRGLAHHLNPTEGERDLMCRGKR